jgi:LysM domain
VPVTSNDIPVLLLPTATAVNPVETNTLIVSPTSGSNPTTYAIHRGEFPYCLARRFNVHPAELLALNGLGDGQGIPPGTTLSIPQNGSQFPGNRSLQSHPTIYIVVSSNETLYSVACLFGDVDPGAIAYANGISIDTALSMGQQLRIP